MLENMYALATQETIRVTISVPLLLKCNFILPLGFGGFGLDILPSLSKSLVAAISISVLNEYCHYEK